MVEQNPERADEIIKRREQQLRDYIIETLTGMKAVAEARSPGG